MRLSWDDIDFNKNIINIRHSLKYNRAILRHELGPTKTGKSREVPMLPNVITAIKQHKAKQAEEKLQAGQEYNANNMVFCDCDGDYFRITNMQYDVNKTVKVLNLNDKTTPHTLRHTFVSQMISSGVTNIKLISTIVGHANINITLDTYGHLMPGDIQEAFKTLGKYMKYVTI